MKRRKQSRRAAFVTMAQAIVDAHVEEMQARLRPRSVRLSEKHRLLVYSLCLRSSLSPEQVIARALEEHAVKQGLGAQVERGRITRRTHP